MKVPTIKGLLSFLEPSISILAQLISLRFICFKISYKNMTYLDEKGREVKAIKKWLHSLFPCSQALDFLATPSIFP